MFAHEATIEVSETPERTFTFLAAPRNQVKLTPGLIALTPVPPGRGFDLQYRYAIAGVVLSGTLRDTLRRSPTRIVRTLSGSLEGSFRYRLAACADGTRTSLGITVRLPAPVRESLRDSVVETALQKDVTATLETLASVLDR